MNKNFFLIVLNFIINEISLTKSKLIFLRNFVKHYSILKFFFYCLNNSIIPIRDKNFKNYILQNKKKWKFNKKINNNETKKYILVTNIVHHHGYTISEIIIAKNLVNILRADEAIVLLDAYDTGSKIIFKSFGFRKFIYLNRSNFYIRLKYFVKAYYIIKSCKNIDDFLKLNLNKVEIGKAVYDNWLRFTGKGTTNKINTDFYRGLSKALLIYDQINKYLKQYNFIASVQAEKQFIPGLIIFQSALVNSINVYSRNGSGKLFSVRKFNDYNERYKSRFKYSQKLFNEVEQSIKEKAIKEGGEIIIKRFKGIPEYQVRSGDHEYYEKHKWQKGKIVESIKKEHLDKKELCEKIGLNPTLPLAVVFSTDLTDGVFDVTWSLFRDRVIWLRSTLNEITKNTNVNWLVKPHPNDTRNKVITDTVSEYNKICSNFNHIKLFPSFLSNSSLPEIIDLAVTVNGSVVSEYPCFGIPAILTAETNASGLGFAIEPKSKQEYLNYLNSFKKPIKLNKNQMDRAKIFIYISKVLTKIPVSLMSTYNIDHHLDKFFWDLMIKCLDNYNYENDLFRKMMKIQIENNDWHTIDYNLLN